MRKYLMIPIALLLINNLILADNIKLSIEDALTIGIENNKSIKISKKSIKESEKKYKISKSELYPKISINSSYLKIKQQNEFGFVNPLTSEKIIVSPEFDSKITNTLSFNQVIFSGFALSNSIKISDYNRKISKSEFQENKSDLLFEINTIYWNLYKLKNMTQIIKKSIVQMRNHLKDIKNYYKEGMATKADILKVKEKISNVELKEIENENKIKKTKLKLKIILGIDINNNIEIVSDIDKNKKEYEYSLNKCIQKGLKKREELKQLKMKKRIADLLVNTAESKFLPKFMLVGNYHYDKPNVSVQPAKNDFSESWEVGVSFSFDIFNGGKRFHELAKNKIAKDKTEILYKQFEENIRKQIFEAYLDYKKEIKSIEYINKNFNEAAENYRITRNLYKEGMVSSSDLLDSEVLFMESKIRKNNSRVDLYLSKLKLDKLIGELKL